VTEPAIVYENLRLLTPLKRLRGLSEVDVGLRNRTASAQEMKDRTSEFCPSVRALAHRALGARRPWGSRRRFLGHLRPGAISTRRLNAVPPVGRRDRNSSRRQLGLVRSGDCSGRAAYGIHPFADRVVSVMASANAPILQWVECRSHPLSQSTDPLVASSPMQTLDWCDREWGRHPR
jgi:hypothetical protein